MNPACELCRGACCESITLNVQHKSADVERWIDLHGQRIAGGLNMDCACTALVDGKCSIYDTRPGVCQDFQVGSVNCLVSIGRRRTPEQRAAIIEVMETMEQPNAGSASE